MLKLDRNVGLEICEVTQKTVKRKLATVLIVITIFESIV
jgi:hypothetical protein